MQLVSTIKVAPKKYAIVDDGEVVSTHDTQVDGSIPVYETDGPLKITAESVLMPAETQ